MKEYNFIEVSEEDRERARKCYGKSVDDIKKDCDVIREWMKQQEHFPDDFDPLRIEYFLLRNKFRVERTKEKLENYYTVRGQNMEFLKGMDPLSEKMQTFFASVHFGVCPKLFDNSERVSFQYYTEKDEAYSFEENVLLVVAISELEPLVDYATGTRIVIDLKNFSVTHFKKSNNISMIHRMWYMYQECLSGRFSAIHLVNASPTYILFLDILKTVLPQKLLNKISLHPNVDSLKEVLPEEYLPSDYGGKLPSFKEMDEYFRKFLYQHRDYLLERLKFVADESKRVGEVPRNDLFGIDGTFKKINID